MTDQNICNTSLRRVCHKSLNQSVKLYVTFILAKLKLNAKTCDVLNNIFYDTSDLNWRSYATNKPVKPCLVSVQSPDIGTGQVSWRGFVAEKSQGLRANFSEKELVILLWCCLLSQTHGKVRKTHLQCSPCLDDSDDKQNIYPIKILSCKLTRDDYIFSNLLIFCRD